MKKKLFAKSRLAVIAFEFLSLKKKTSRQQIGLQILVEIIGLEPMTSRM